MRSLTPYPRPWQLAALALALCPTITNGAQRYDAPTLEMPPPLRHPAMPGPAKAVGDLLEHLTVPVLSSGCCGIGIELDGAGRITYSNTDACKLYFTDLSVTDLGFIDLIDDGSGNFSCPLDGPNALAFNNTDGHMYFGGWSSTSLYKANMSTGEVTRVKLNAIVAQCCSFIDGLAWDASDNSFWMSDDVSCTVNHLDVNGDPHPDGRTFDGCAVVGFSNSGVVLNGAGDTMWYGTNGNGEIYQLDMTTNPPTNLGSFSTPGGRDEDMDCGPLYTKSDGTVVETLLSKDAHDNTFVVLEAPDGTCDQPVLPVGDPVVVCTGCPVCNDPGVCTADIACTPGVAVCVDPVEGVDVDISCAPPGPYPVGPMLPVDVTCTNSGGVQVSATCSVSVRDCEPPTCQPPLPEVLQCDMPCGVSSANPIVQGFLAGAVGDDNCAVDTITAHAPAVFAAACAGAPTPVTFIVTDSAGYEATCVSSVTVIDTLPPTLAVPPPLVLECVSPAGAPSAGCEAQSWLASATADDLCFEATVTHNAPADFPLDCAGAATDVSFVAVDSCGNSSMAVVSTVTVVDTIPPVVLNCGLRPALPPAGPGSANSANSGASTTYRVDCGSATDACSDATPPSAELVITHVEVVDGMCVSTEEVIPVLCDELVELELLAQPCPARPPASASAAGSPNSGGGGPLTGQAFEVRVTSADGCGNIGACVATADCLVPTPAECDDPCGAPAPLARVEPGFAPPAPPAARPPARR